MNEFEPDYMKACEYADLVLHGDYSQNVKNLAMAFREKLRAQFKTDQELQRLRGEVREIGERLAKL